MGHSFGTISARWLAKNLGSEISGSMHSASMNGANAPGYANSLSGFSYGTIAAPMLHVHNENDACPHTPYSIVKGYAGENLVTVRGGVPGRDPSAAALTCTPTGGVRSSSPGRPFPGSRPGRWIG